MEEYNSNPEFREYVDKYCIKMKCTPETATRHLIVRNVEAEYRHRRVDCKDVEKRRY